MGGFTTKKALLENTSRYAYGMTDKHGRRIRLVPYRAENKRWYLRYPKNRR